MCDYSLAHAKSRPAKVEDKLTVRDFGMTTKGFAAPEDSSTAVCLLPGTEVAFDAPVKYKDGWYDAEEKVIDSTVARFRQVDKDNQYTHHDALEFGNGVFVKLTHLITGQTATVLQMPVAPTTPEEAKAQERLPMVERVPADLTTI